MSTPSHLRPTLDHSNPSTKTNSSQDSRPPVTVALFHADSRGDDTAASARSAALKETDPELPLRAAVRMSMGVPGLMEPFKYRGEAAGRCQLGVRISSFVISGVPKRDIRAMSMRPAFGSILSELLEVGLDFGLPQLGETKNGRRMLGSH